MINDRNIQHSFIKPKNRIINNNVAIEIKHPQMYKALNIVQCIVSCNISPISKRCKSDARCKLSLTKARHYSGAGKRKLISCLARLLELY